MGSLAYAKRKGRDAENDVVELLRATGYPTAERRAKFGTSDRGDIVNGPGVIEVKNRAELAPAAWLRELDVEKVNAGEDTGAVVFKVRGLLVPDWPAMLRLRDYLDLCAEAFGR